MVDVVPDEQRIAAHHAGIVELNLLVRPCNARRSTGACEWRPNTSSGRIGRYGLFPSRGRLIPAQSGVSARREVRRLNAVESAILRSGVVKDDDAIGEQPGRL